METLALPPEIANPLRTRCDRETLKYACGRAIFCRCGASLDCRRALLIDASIGHPSQTTWWNVPPERSYIGAHCIRCGEYLARVLRARGWAVEITDGRVLFPPPAPRRKPDRTAPRPHGIPHAHRLGRCRRCGVVWHGKHVRVGLPCPQCRRPLARTTCDASADYREIPAPVGAPLRPTITTH